MGSGENLENCRDANEDHGLSFEGGCDAQYKNQIGAPIPEDDSVCWEIERFGYTDDGFDDGPTPPGPTPTKKPTKTPTGPPPVSEDDDEAPTGSGTDDESPSGSEDDDDTSPGSGTDDESLSGDYYYYYDASPGSGTDNESPSGWDYYYDASTGSGTDDESRSRSEGAHRGLRGKRTV